MRIIGLFIFLLAIKPVSAQQPRVSKWNQQMKLVRCSLDIQAGPMESVTFMELEFYNPGNEPIEGWRSIRLDDGQFVTGFQLELDGCYRDGSIEERWKAANAYNTIVGKRIDPALLQWQGNDHYSLNIFPVPAGGSRKVTITVRQLTHHLQDKWFYRLPLDWCDPETNFTVNIRVSGGAGLPVPTEGALASHHFVRTGDSHANLQIESSILKGNLVFSVEAPAHSLVARSGNNQLQVLARPSVPVQQLYRQAGLIVFWDVSASAGCRDINREMRFLRSFLHNTGQDSFRLIPFNYRLHTPVMFAARDSLTWQSYIGSLLYEGGTQLGCLRFDFDSVSQYLLFSDGKNSYGRTLPPTATVPVSAVTTCSASDFEVLANISGISGGRVISLTTSRPDTGYLKEPLTTRSWLMKVEGTDAPVTVDNKLPLPVDSVLHLSIHTTAGNIVLCYGYAGIITHRDTFNVAAAPLTEVSSWVRILSEGSGLVSGPHAYKLFDWGKKNGIVTAYTSYLVLERLEDYIRYNISLPPDLRMMISGSQQKSENGNAVNISGSMITPESNEVVVKRTMISSVSYAASVPLPPGSSIPELLQGRVPGLMVTSSGDPGAKANIRIRGLTSITQNQPPLYVLDGFPVDGLQMIDWLTPTDIESITVLKDNHATALYGSRGVAGVILINTKRRIRYPQTYSRYRLEDQPEMEYIEAMRILPADEWERAYHQMRSDHLKDPSFFMDMACFFQEKGQHDRAMTILTEAAEDLSMAVGIQRMFGFLLESWKNWDEAASLYRWMLETYPDDISLARNLFLVLYQQGNRQQAVDLAAGVLRNAARYDTIWSSAILAQLRWEMNGMIKAHRNELDLSGIDSSLLLIDTTRFRISVEDNNGHSWKLVVREPGGSMAAEGKVTRRGGTVSQSYLPGGIRTAVYNSPAPKKGPYNIRLDIPWTYRYNWYRVPNVVRTIVFRDFGTPEGKMEIINSVIDNQTGRVELKELKW